MTLSVHQMQRGIERLGKRLEELEAFDVAAMQAGNPPELVALETAISSTLSAVFGENTANFRRFQAAASLTHYVMQVPGRPTPVGRYIEVTGQNIGNARALLEQAIRMLCEELEPEPIEQPTQVAQQQTTNKVFVVHGHDDAAKLGLARFLEKIELEAVILHEQPDQGRTIVEKFEACAAEVGFAVILLTPDDMGGTGAAPAQARARQNVVFELGYFAGKLGRGKVCLMRKGNIEIPSDLYGVIYTELDANDGWKMKLARELKAAGFAFDAEKVWG